MLFRKKYRLFYHLPRGSVTYADNFSVGDLTKVCDILDELSDGYYFGVYHVPTSSRSLVKWLEEKRCFRIEIAFGDDGVYRDLTKQELVSLFQNFENIISNPKSFMFIDWIEE